MMRFFKPTVFLLPAFLFLSLFARAQDSVIVSWKTTTEKITEGKYTIIFYGTIKKGWHIYTAPNTEADMSGITTSLEDSSIILKEIQFVTKSIVPQKDVLGVRNLKVASDSIIFFQIAEIPAETGTAFFMQVHYSVADGESFYPESSPPLKIFTGTGPAPAAVSNRILIETINLSKPLTDCKTSSSISDDKVESKGMMSLFFLGFLGGLVALLTPCVFPMIPLTVSFFTKKAENRKSGVKNAFLYSFFIFLIYILLSLPFHFLDKLNPDILNNISTNVYLNVGFFIIFIVFAISFFGYFEITLPSSFSNRTDSKAEGGNWVGIFFMALTLALVSFSCTGPILGSLLAGSLTADGGAMQLTAGMAGFGLALALPFGLFALFPGLLNSLPKSGGWLTTVKVILGFLELALAFKFLSNADLVTHWGILKREIFIGIWIIIGIFLSLYLWGFIKFPHDSPIKKLPTIRIILATLVTLFTFYLLPGVTNTKYANLSLISGFPPPLYYSIYPGKSDCVFNLNCTRDYEEGLRMAREQNKSILLDFTGYACVNCRRMEENVWSKPDVNALMKEKFIVISLYVDDKKLLPAAERFTYITKEGSKREIRTVGDKWANFETENFKNNAQPLYAILNTKEELLSHPAAYTPSVKDYLRWLQCGADAFDKK